MCNSTVTTWIDPQSAKYRAIELVHNTCQISKISTRLQTNFITGYSYRKEVSVVLKKIANENRDCVIALPPSGLRDAFLRVVRKIECVTIAVEDTPTDIAERIAFFDIDSRPIEKHLTVNEKRLYLKEIKKDITFFGKSYRRADLHHVDIAGLDPKASAEKIERLLVVLSEVRSDSRSPGS